MTRLFTILSIVLFPVLAFAVPFLVCDSPPADQEGAQYEVFQDSVSLGIVNAEPDGSLKYDLQGITPGVYSWTATAINVWGVSLPSNPYQSPSVVLPPSNFRLE